MSTLSGHPDIRRLASRFRAALIDFDDALAPEGEYPARRSELEPIRDAFATVLRALERLP